MLFTQWNLEDALDVRYEEGHEDGFKEGHEDGFKEGFENGAEKGEIIKLISLVNRKYQKGKSEAVIAEELEEDVEAVGKICQAIKAADMDDIDVIYKILCEL